MLETSRFTMRKLVESDATALFPTFSDETQCRYMSQPHFEDVETLAGWLSDPTWPGRTWIAVDKSDGRISGRYVAFPGRDDAVLELGYITVIDRQGRGVAKECMSALVDHLFSQERCRKLYMEIDAQNAASVALAQSLGFMREGLLREHEITHIGVCDLLIFGLLQRDWNARREAGGLIVGESL